MSIQDRSAPRKPTNRAGTIKADGKEYAVLLRDMSDVGARLRVVGNFKVPDRFNLVASLEKIDAACVVMWRRGNDIGVRFEEPVAVSQS